MKNIKSYRFVTWMLLLVICLPGCGPDHGPAASTCCTGGMSVEPPQAMSAWRLADMNSQLKLSTETPVNANINIAPGESKALELIGLGLETVGIGLEIWGHVERRAEFEEINNRLDQIDKKLGVIEEKVDRIQKLLVEGLDALSLQLDVSFADLKSFIVNKDINDRISKIETYAFTTDPSGLYWICAKDQIKNNSKDKMLSYIKDWRAAVGVVGTYNIATMLNDIHRYIIPTIALKDNQAGTGALDTYVDYLIAKLNEAASKKTMNYDALKAAYLSYEHFYSTILYWEHVGATLHTELYNSLGDQTAARGYLEGTFKQHIAAQNQRFFENGLRLVAAFSSYVPKGRIITPCYSRIYLLFGQQQLLARLGFFVASYQGYEAYGDKGTARLTQRIVLVRQDLLTTTSPLFGFGSPGRYASQGPLPPYATVPMEGRIFNVYFFPSLDLQFDMIWQEYGVLGVWTDNYRGMRCEQTGVNFTFDAILPESIGSYNWNYTTDCLDPNHVFLNRNFIIIDD
jgi:hypothetical protein